MEALATLVLLYVAIVITVLTFVISQIVHCATRCPQKERTTWILIILLAPAGSIIYCIVQRPKAVPPVLAPKRHTYANVPPPQPKKKDPHGFADMDDLFNPPPC